MISKTSTTTRRLLNLYRQHNVIYGGWSVINPLFLAEADTDVLSELKSLPTGSRLVKHIENLRSGKTPINSIDKNLLPYGKMMSDDIISMQLSESEIQEIKTALQTFTPDITGLEKIKSLSSIKQFGNDWLVGIRSAITNDKELLNKLEIVNKTLLAHNLWKSANEILSSPLSEKLRAQVQADLPEYETYLPMFGDSGSELLAKLRKMITSIK